MAGNIVYEQAKRAIELAQRIVDDRFPGARFDWDLSDIDESSPGFGVAFQQGVTLVQAPVTNDTGTWCLVLTSGIAFDLDNIGAALNWVNRQNKAIGLGRYFCSVSEERDTAAIVYENAIWGGMFNAFHDGGFGDVGPAKSLVARIVTEITASVAGAAQDCHEVLSNQSGRPFARSNLNDLFVLRE